MKKVFSCNRIENNTNKIVPTDKVSVQDGTGTETHPAHKVPHTKQDILDTAKNDSLPFKSYLPFLCTLAGVLSLSGYGLSQKYQEHQKELTHPFYEQKAICVGKEVNAKGQSVAVFRVADNPKIELKSRVFVRRCSIFVTEADTQTGHSIIEENIGKTFKICEWNNNHFKIFRWEQEKLR